MINSELLAVLARRRADELLQEAERRRLALPGAPRRPIRLRRRRVTVEIHLSPDLRPEQVDQIFASLARHLGTG